MKRHVLLWVNRQLRRFRMEVVVRARPGEEPVPVDFDDRTRATVLAVRPYTMTSAERIGALVAAVDHVVRNRVEGDVVECGVWKGGSMMAAARTLLQHDDVRELHLFDTFAGMTPPGDLDRNFRGTSAADMLEREPDPKGWTAAIAGLDEVRSNMASTGYPMDRVHFVVGRVEDTIPEQAPERIAVLRLDTDWYESTKHELEHLLPRVMPNGVLLIDDYGHWEGARRAVDEALAAWPHPLLLCRVDYTGRVAVVAR